MKTEPVTHSFLSLHSLLVHLFMSLRMTMTETILMHMPEGSDHTLNILENSLTASCTTLTTAMVVSLQMGKWRLRDRNNFHKDKARETRVRTQVLHH
jgi:hypothetical protein